MNNSYVVGNVIEIDGLSVRIRMHENSNLFSYFHDGKKYQGVSIGTYVGVIRGPYKIIGKVVKEFLKDKDKDFKNQSFNIERYNREIEISVIGSFLQNKFIDGITVLPMIYNEVVLLEGSEIETIISNNSNPDTSFPLGVSLQEELLVNIPWNRLFNTHIGIFGNTGSGKSNTLARIYKELFSLNANPKFLLSEKSRFVFIDFNGEYLGNKVLNESKETIELLGKKTEKIPLNYSDFWDVETLSILFSATEQTQKPLLKKAIEQYVYKDNEYVFKNENILQYLRNGFINTFVSKNPKTLDLFKKICFIAGIEEERVPLINSSWHSNQETFYTSKKNLREIDMMYYDGNDYGLFINDENDALNYSRVFVERNTNHNFNDLNEFEKLEIAINLQLIYGLRYNHVQFDFISPLLHRIESNSKELSQVITIDETQKSNAFIEVISLKHCSIDIKKIIPLLLVKKYYKSHKLDSNVSGKIEKTFHLIIDEAHNVLSNRSSREKDTWKDYRLDVFEEVIKEGRKFGFYITISSQRPADISPTIISQIHNFFIHRLVNDKDLQLLDNTITTLDRFSKQNIPNLSKGQCVLTGTTFSLPLIVKVSELGEDEKPMSNDADLVDIWKVDED